MTTHMSDSKTRGRRRSGAQLSRKVAATVLTAGVLSGALIAAPVAQAAVGGGSAGGGGVGAGASSYLLLTYDDISYADPAQGWGNDSINTFKSMMAAQTTYQPLQGLDATEHFDRYIRASCNTALAEASARGGGARSRVVQVGTTMYPGGINGSWVAAWGGDAAGFSNWYRGIADAQNSANLGGWPLTNRNDVKNTFLANIGAEPRAVCVAVNEFEIITDYALNVSTDKGATFGMAGSRNPVNDVIHANPGDSPIRENASATVNLHWNGPEGQSLVRSKGVTISNNGDTRSPDFTPADFGWNSWPAGGFWFDVIVARQGKMRAAVDTPNNDPRESWSSSAVAPVKTLTHGGTTAGLGDTDVLASGMFYDARIRAHSNGYTSSMTIKDIIGTDKVFIGARDRDVASGAYILDPSGNRVGNAVINVNRGTAGQVTVSGTVPSVGNQGEYTLVVPTYVVPTGADYTIPDSSEVCYTSSQAAGCLTGNSKQTRKVTPAPDQVWVLDTNGKLRAAAPDETNQTAADNLVFLPGDSVAASVKGRVPADLSVNLTNYQIIDDWSKAAKYVDFSDAAKAKVFFRGGDVTSQFNVSVAGTVTTATAKPEFLARTSGLGEDASVQLVISGAFRTDYLTGGETVTLHNSGSEVWNNEVQPANESAVFTWTPDPGKQVNGSAEESGGKIHDNIDGLAVLPGQKLEYSIQLDLTLPKNTALGVKTLALEDSYDPQLTPDKASVEFFDSRTRKPIARSAYNLSFDEANHSFTAEFTPEWIAENVVADGANSEWEEGGWLMVRFTGTVKADTVGGSTVRNQAFQVVNGVKTASEIPEVVIPFIAPDKESLDTNLDSIDGKTVVQGDHILYRLSLDGGPTRDELAYDVHKLGMVDDYDEEYLDLSTEAIKVTSKLNGADVTDKFNVQVKDGSVYVFAKQVDSTNAYGDLIKGDPQPADLAAYDSAAILPHTTAIIDQTLLGQDYWITLDTVVSKEVNDYTIVNRARQNLQNTQNMTGIVSNPLKDIDPDKDVVLDEENKDGSLNGQEVKLYSTFNYRLNSSEIPADRAYGASDWSLSDTFDQVHDAYTGIWAVYADSDVYDGAELIFKKGDLLADSAAHESEPYDALFEVDFNEESHTFTAVATQKYLDLVNTRGDLAQGFSVYTKMERIAPGEAIVNKVAEKYNGVDRESNTVTTVTTEHPAIRVEKYTLDEGLEKGRHDDAALAHELTGDQLTTGVQVGYRISNTGDVPLTNLAFADTVAEGTYGSVDDVLCEVPLDEETKDALENGSEAPAADTTWISVSAVTGLALEEAVNCQGTLLGMEPGMQHSGPVTVTGESVFTAVKVEGSDSWHAKAPEAPGISVVKYTLDEGLEKGDRNVAKEGLELTPEQAKDGVQIGFQVSNTGDVPLRNVVLSDVTLDGTTGKVNDLVCVDPDAPVATEEATGEPAADPAVVSDEQPAPAAAMAAEMGAKAVMGGDGVSEEAKERIRAAAEAAAKKAAAKKAAEEEAAKAKEEAAATAAAEAAAADERGVIDDSASTAPPAESKPFELAVGETVDCTGLLTAVQMGTTHADVATVTGESLYTGNKVQADDSWNALLLKKIAMTGEAVSSVNPIMVSGGLVAILVALAAGAGLLVRRTRSSVADKQ